MAAPDLSAASVAAVAAPRAPGVLGGLVIAPGPGTAEWVRGLDGFTAVATPGEPIHAAVRGAVHTGRAENGTRWLAVADLIEGRLPDGVRALEDGTPPQRD